MIGLLHFLQRKLRPELDSRSSAMRYLLMSDVIGTLYSFPLILLGLSWLVFHTDWAGLTSHWPWLLVILVAIVIFSRLRFYMMRELRSGNNVGTDGDFVGVILWASLLIFGPGIIWLFLLWIVVELGLAWRRAINADMRWDAVRSAMLNASSLLIPSLLALIVYENLGGSIPLIDLTLPHLLPALGAVLIYAITYFLIWLPFILYIVWVQGTKYSMNRSRGLFWFSVISMELPFISLPLGVLASGLYVAYGPAVLGINFLSLLFIALLANQLSRSAAQSRRHTIQLMGLEQLGRDILAAPTDARNLPGLLRKHLPNMFPCRRVDVWLEPETYLLKYPDGKDNYAPHIWPWLMEQVEPIGFLESETLPWEQAPDPHFALLTAPILDPITGETIGGLFIELLTLPQAWDKKTILEHHPALQNLAAQIATALKQAENYQENMKHRARYPGTAVSRGYPIVLPAGSDP